MRKRITEKVKEVIQNEAPKVGPAVRGAASHAAVEFGKKFWEIYGETGGILKIRRIAGSVELLLRFDLTL